MLANFAAQLVLALHWFNPLAWYGWRAMRRDQEAACDHRVITGRTEAERARYALLLANTAAGARFALAAPMACPVLGEKSIIHRLRNLARPGPSRRRQMAGKAGLAAAVLALLSPMARLFWLPALACALAMLLPPEPRPGPGQLWVTVLDVGQGLSVLLQTREHDLLYDTGARFVSGFDLGEAVVHPALLDMAV